MPKKKIIHVVLANPDEWSDKSKQSVSYQCNFVKEYKDIHYHCRRCKKASIFTAEDQKYAYEVKKFYIDQKRILCRECWEQSNEITNRIQICEGKWAKSKNQLKDDCEFLSVWLDLLSRRQQYEPYRPNTAIQNMLKKLIIGKT